MSRLLRTNLRTRLTILYTSLLAIALLLYAGGVSVLFLINLRDQLDLNIHRDIETVEGALTANPSGGPQISGWEGEDGPARPRHNCTVRRWVPSRQATQVLTGRARIEITTAGGRPQIHGAANFLYRDSLFDARNPFALVKSGEQRTYYEGSLTGPLSRSKKTTFLLALDTDSDNQQAVVVAAGPSGPLNANIPNPTHHYFLSGRVFHDYGEANQLWGDTPTNIEPWQIWGWAGPFSRKQAQTPCSLSMRSTSAMFISSRRSF
jgi:hypothetical protein